MSNGDLQNGVVTGSPGTQPTNTGWEGSQSGLTRTITQGIGYVDVRYAGTAIANNRIDNNFGILNDVAGIAGDKREGFFDMDIINGVGADPLSTFTGQLIRIREIEADGVTQAGSGTQAIVFAPGRQVYSYKRHISGVTAAFTQVRLEFNYIATQVVDITFRIYEAGIRQWV